MISHDRYVTPSKWRRSRRHGSCSPTLVDDRPAAGIPGPGMSIPSIKYGNASVEGRQTWVRVEQCGSVLRHGQSHAHSPLARGERAVSLPRLVKSASLASEPSESFSEGRTNKSGEHYHESFARNHQRGWRGDP